MKIKNICRIAVIFGLISCKQVRWNVPESPPGYDFSKPVKFWMPEKLDEISGLTIQDEEVYAVQDELGRLYHFQLDSDKITSTRFGNKADYEDLAILDSTVFILESNGTIYSFPLSMADADEVKDTRKWNLLATQCEYEGSFAYSGTHQLYILSKECKNDKKTQKRSGIILKWEKDSLSVIDSFAIDLDLVRKINGNKKSKFNPSALALHPVTHEWYILSSSNNWLLIADPKWSPILRVKLKASFFTQPEGICFDATGNLYIANEKGSAFEGRILKFEISPVGTNALD